MMSCDFASGKLNWNTALIDEETLRTVKGQGERSKKPVGKDGTIKHGAHGQPIDPKTGLFMKKSKAEKEERAEGAKGGSKKRADKDTLDLTGLKPMKRSTQSSLDNLVSMMEAQEVVPEKSPSIEVSQTKAKGMTSRVKRIDPLDAIAMKYVKKSSRGRGKTCK